MNEASKDKDITDTAHLMSLLGHPTRVEILKVLNQGSTSFSDIVDHLKLESSSKLSFHISKLSPLVEKDDKGNYKLKPLGRQALAIIHQYEDNELIVKKQEKLRHLEYRQNAGFVRNPFILFMWIVGFTLAIQYLLVLVSFYLVEDVQLLILFYPFVAVLGYMYITKRFELSSAYIAIGSYLLITILLFTRYLHFRNFITVAAFIFNSNYQIIDVHTVTVLNDVILMLVTLFYYGVTSILVVLFNCQAFFSTITRYYKDDASPQTTTGFNPISEYIKHPEYWYIGLAGIFLYIGLDIITTSITFELAVGQSTYVIELFSRIAYLLPLPFVSILYWLCFTYIQALKLDSRQKKFLYSLVTGILPIIAIIPGLNTYFIARFSVPSSFQPFFLPELYLSNYLFRIIVLFGSTLTLTILLDKFSVISSWYLKPSYKERYKFINVSLDKFVLFIGLLLFVYMIINQITPLSIYF